MIARILARCFGTPAERRRHPHAPSLRFEVLEPRRVLAATISLDIASGLLTLDGTAADELAQVSDLGNGLIQAEIAGVEIRQFSTSDVSSISFLGRNGNDTFENYTNLPSIARGHKGNDVLVGGTATDRFYGGDGNDFLQGNAGWDYLAAGGGNDEVRGGAGNDELFGGGGNDILEGHGGHDDLYGGTGDDVLRGHVGDDYLAGGHHDDQLFGGDGVDYLSGFSGNDLLYGGNGDDQLYGQHGSDELHGQSGGDRVRGGPDVDWLYGGAGDDYMMGDQADDVMFGQSGADRMFGYIGNDLLDGGADDDLIYGQADDDVILAGDGNDVATGQGGDDRINGGAGDDYINGHSGHDWLRGDAGQDAMYGGSGDDSLFGGAAAENDTLVGNADQDRFLVRNGDLAVDPIAEDAVLVFEDVTSNWNDVEIEVVDKAFQQLYQRTGNAALMRDPLTTDPLTFYKYEYLGGAAGINYLSWYSETTCDVTGCETTYTYHREIQIADWDESIPFYNDAFQAVVIHEIGHNWDSELEMTSALDNLQGLWDSFMSISQWQPDDPGPGYTQSLDGQWWYLSTAEFAEDYGRSNPHEDFSTSWQYYFGDYQDASLDHSGLQSKMDLLDALFDQLI